MALNPEVWNEPIPSKDFPGLNEAPTFSKSLIHFNEKHVIAKFIALPVYGVAQYLAIRLEWPSAAIGLAIMSHGPFYNFVWGRLFQLRSYLQSKK